MLSSSGLTAGVDPKPHLALKLLSSVRNNAHVSPPGALPIDTTTARNEVRAKIVELASRTTLKKPVLRDDEVIPETGLLDSPTIMELVAWLETRFGVDIDQRELTIENFGTVNAIVNYLGEHARPMA